MDVEQPNPATSGDAARPRVPHWALLCLILLLAAALRFYHIGKHSMWLDEFLALENSTGRGHLHVKLPVNTVLDPAPAPADLHSGPGLLKIWTSLEDETHPPLYFMLLNLWRHVAGDSDLAARAFSAIVSLAGIVLLYETARLLHGPAAALWACLIMAVAGPQIQFSQEARPYTMLLTFILAAALALVRIEKLGPSVGRALALSAAMLGILLTHYLSFGSAAALGLYALLGLRGSSRKAAAAAIAAAVLLYAASWGPLFYQQSKNFSEAHKWMLDSNSGVAVTLGRMAGVPIRFFMEPLTRSWAAARLGAVLFVIPLLLLPRRRDLLLWCLLLFIPVVQVAVSDMLRGAQAIGLYRYTFASTAPAYAMVAAMLAARGSNRWLQHLVPAAVVLACLAAIERVYTYSAPDWREPGAVLRDGVRPGDLIVFEKNGQSDWQGGFVYLAAMRYAPPTTPVAIVGASEPDPQLTRRIKTSPRVWVVIRGDGSPAEHQRPDRPATLTRSFPFCCTIFLYE